MFDKPVDNLFYRPSPNTSDGLKGQHTIAHLLLLTNITTTGFQFLGIPTNVYPVRSFVMSNRIEENVAIVALLVSLVALIVTASQLLLQLFNSADGYRRCGASVIDVWHRKRHRKWKWSEFRFETRYVTPQIVLVTPQECEIYNRQYGDVFLLNGPSLQHVTCQELNTTAHQNHCHMESRSRRSVEMIEQSSSSKQNISDLEKAGSTVILKDHKLARARAHSESLVSWLDLLRDLHCLSHSYWPLDCSACATQKIDNYHTGVTRSEFSSVCDDFGDEHHSKSYCGDERHTNLGLTTGFNLAEYA